MRSDFACALAVVLKLGGGWGLSPRDACALSKQSQAVFLSAQPQGQSRAELMAGRVQAHAPAVHHPASSRSRSLREWEA